MAEDETTATLAGRDLAPSTRAVLAALVGAGAVTGPGTRAHAGPALPVAALAAATGLARPTVGAALSRLAAAGRAERVAATAGGRGAPARWAATRQGADLLPTTTDTGTAAPDQPDSDAAPPASAPPPPGETRPADPATTGGDPDDAPSPPPADAVPRETGSDPGDAVGSEPDPAGAGHHHDQRDTAAPDDTPAGGPDDRDGVGPADTSTTAGEAAAAPEDPAATAADPPAGEAEPDPVAEGHGTTGEPVTTPVPACAALACPAPACPMKTGATTPPSPAAPARARTRPARPKTAPPANADGQPRLLPGELHRLVVDLLRANPEAVFSPTEAARELGRSNGAVSLVLEKAATAGDLRRVQDKPRRYQAPAKIAA